MSRNILIAEVHQGTGPTGDELHRRFTAADTTTSKTFLTYPKDMQPRFVGRLGLADIITVANAAIGFLAVTVAIVDPHTAARLILLAAVADGLDGVVARHRGGTSVGPYLDSLADVSSFAIAPAVLVFVISRETTWFTTTPALHTALLFGVPTMFVAMAIVRLSFYTAHDTTESQTVGVPSTLAATIIAVLVLAGHGTATLLLAAAATFTYLMVSPIRYPDLLARDAFIMGIVHVLALTIPAFYGRMFPYALLTLAVAYLVLGPWFYWGEHERSLRATETVKRKRS